MLRGGAIGALGGLIGKLRNQGMFPAATDESRRMQNLPTEGRFSTVSMNPYGQLEMHEPMYNDPGIDYGKGASGYIDSPTSGDRINYSVDDEDEFYKSLLGHYQEMGPDGQMYNMRRMAPNMWINADMFPTDNSWRNYQESSVEINPSNVDNKLVEDRIGEGVGQNFRRGY